MHQHRPETTDFTMPEENPDTSAVQRPAGTGFLTFAWNKNNKFYCGLDCINCYRQFPASCGYPGGTGSLASGSPS
jgi:hypothetical protein